MIIMQFDYQRMEPCLTVEKKKGGKLCLKRFGYLLLPNKEGSSSLSESVASFPFCNFTLYLYTSFRYTQ